MSGRGDKDEENLFIYRCAVMRLVIKHKERIRPLPVKVMHHPVKMRMQTSSKTSLSDSSDFFSAEDDWLDVSGFLDQAYGFLPIAGVITEPAVGYGMWGGLAFMNRPLGEAKAGIRPPEYYFRRRNGDPERHSRRNGRGYAPLDG